jgi:hypothetical protein
MAGSGCSRAHRVLQSLNIFKGTRAVQIATGEPDRQLECSICFFSSNGRQRLSIMCLLWRVCPRQMMHLWH